MYILPALSENKFNPSLRNALRMGSEAVNIKKNQNILWQIWTGIVIILIGVSGVMGKMFLNGTRVRIWYLFVSLFTY
jgi:hypothetical protein